MKDKEAIQIKIGSRLDGGYAAMTYGYHIGKGSTIQEALSDFLKINKLENTKWKWS
jgi:hypothetical protein